MASTTFENKLTKQSLIDLLHPIGSIYISTDDTDPGTLFSNTRWEQINDIFLVASGLQFPAGQPQGNKTVSFAANGTIEATAIDVHTMPAHSHQMNHTHTSDTYTIQQNASNHQHTWYGAWQPAVSGYTKFAAFAASSGSVQETSSILDDGKHSHSITGSSGNAYIKVNNQDVQAYTTSVGSGLGHDHVFTGTTQTMDTSPPYLSVNIWKRTE